MQGVPDTLTANVGIEFSAPDVTAAMNQTNDRQQAVIDALVGAGLDRQKISTTQVSLAPQYSNPGPNGTATITGYRASNAIEVKIHQLTPRQRMLALIVGTGGDATRISSVSYSIADDSQLVKDARARAFNDAKDRAAQYAQLSGLKLGRVMSIRLGGDGRRLDARGEGTVRNNTGHAVGSAAWKRLPALDGEFLADSAVRGVQFD